MKNGSCADPTLLAAHGAEVRLKTDAEREVRGQKTPSVPTQVEVDNHNLTHEPFKDWCEVCTMYRARQTSMLVQIIHIQVTAFFCPSPLPFGGSTVLSLTRGPAAKRTTTGSLSATQECRDTNCTTRTTTHIQVTVFCTMTLDTAQGCLVELTSSHVWS